MIMDDDYVLCIGERCNDKSRVGEKLERGKSVWLANPSRAVLSCPAFSFGASRKRLVEMIGTEKFRGRNLMWPTAVAGEWDARVAGELAMAVFPYLPPKTVLLGRKVATAFNCEDVPFGETRALEKPYGSQGDKHRREFLVLPHPSGRSRVCNCEVEMEIMREAFRAFSV